MIPKNAKKIIAVLLTLAVLLSTVFAAFSATAKETAAPKIYQVTFGSPAIPVFVNTSVDLKEVAVQFTADGDMITGDKIDWVLDPNTEKDAVILSGTTLSAFKKGIYIITAKIQNTDETKKVYICVNLSGDYDFILTEFDFSGETRDTIIKNPDLMLTHASDWGSGHETPFYRLNWIADAWDMHYPSQTRDHLYVDRVNDLHTVYYTEPILKDFADYTFTVKAAGGPVYDTSALKGFILRANVDFSASSDSVNLINGKNLYFVHRYYGSVGIGSYGNENMIGNTSRGYANDSLHSLEGDAWKYFINTTDEYKKTEDKTEYDPAVNPEYIFGEDISKIHDINIVLDGSQIEYTFDKKTILDTSKTVYKLSEARVNSTATSTEFDYETAFAANGYRGAGNAIGFTFVQGQFAIYSFSVKLNVESAVDMPYSTHYTVSDINPVIPLTAGKQVNKENFLVAIGDTVYSASALGWELTDKNESVIFEENYIGAYKKGVYTLTATAPTGEKITVYLVVKNSDETEYTVFFEDYRSSLEKTGDTYKSRTDYGNWSTFVQSYSDNSVTVAAAGNYAGNITEGARIGLLPYDNYNIMTDAGITSGQYRIVSVLDNEIIGNLTNYKFTATLIMDPGGSGAIGLVGRINGTGADTAATGVLLTATGSYLTSSTKEKNVYKVLGGGAPTVLSGEYSEAWFSSWGSSRTQRMTTLKECSLEFNGNTVKYDFSAVNHQNITYTVDDTDIKAGNIGLYVYGQHYSSHSIAAPTIYDISVTLVGMEDAENKMGVTDIDGYVSSDEETSKYPEIEESYLYTLNGTTITAVTANSELSVLGEKITIPAIVGGVTVKQLGNGSWSYAESVRVFESVKNNIKEIDLSSTQITAIGGGAFYGMPYVEIIKMPSTLTTIKASRAFSSMGSLREMYIPNVTVATWNDFYSNRNLERIDISGVSKISEQTFDGCVSLNYVKLGNKLAEIENNAFRECKALYEIELPESLTKIGAKTFQDCVALENIVIPKSVTAIGANAFSGCTSLKSIYIENPATEIADTDIPTTTVIYGYEGSTAELYAADKGCEFIAIENSTSHTVSVNSISQLPTEIFGYDVVWQETENENFSVDNEGNIIALQKGSNTVIGAMDMNGVAVETVLTVNVTDYDKTASNFANEDFGVSVTDTENTYTLNVLSDGLKPKTLKICGQSVLPDETAVDGIASGKQYDFYCENIFELSVSGEFERDENAYNSSIYGLGATVEDDSSVDGYKLRFVFRTSAIIPSGTTIEEGGKLIDGVTLNGEKVTPSAVGAFMVPEVLLNFKTVVPTLKEGFDIDKNEVKINNCSYPAANVKVKFLEDMTYDYSDFYVVLTDIANEMRYVGIVCVPYIVYNTTDGTQGVIYGDCIIRSHDTANATLHKTEEEVLSLYRPETEERIEEIKNTVSTIVPTGNGKAYYISSSAGDDSYDGMSPTQPIKTLTHLNELSLNEGDVVYFKRGDIWRGTVMCKNGVSYTCYGDGAKPEIYASLANYAKVGSWDITDVPNVYRYSEPQTADVGTIVFDGGIAHGIKQMKQLGEDGLYYNVNTGEPFDTYDDLDTHLHFFHDESDDYVYLYYEGGNPADMHNSIEFCLRNSIMCVTEDINNVTVDNIVFRYGGAHGISSVTTTGLTVQNCEFYWIGGGRQSEKGTTTRFGNAVEIWGGAYDFTIDNCYFYQIYDAAATFQFFAKDEATNESVRHLSAVDVNFTNNVMEYCNYSVEYFLNTPPNEINEINGFTISGNHMWYAGYGFCSQRPDRSEDCHIKSWGHANPNVSNYNITDNVFAFAYSYLSETYSETETSELPRYCDNVYIQYNGHRLGRTGMADKYTTFDYEVRKTIYSEFGDTTAKIIWVK